MTVAILIVIAHIGRDGDNRGSTKDRPANSRVVSRQQYGTDWPLTVDDGLLRCDIETRAGRDLFAVTFMRAGVLYAVNGGAETLRIGSDIAPIWADAEQLTVRDPQPPHNMVKVGPKKKCIGPLIQTA